MQRSLAALAAHPEPWIWELLADLVHGRRRSEFDALVQSTAQALATIDDGRDDPPVRVTGPAAGGTRSTRSSPTWSSGRPAAARAARSGPPCSATCSRCCACCASATGSPRRHRDLRIVLTHFELGERLFAVDTDCAALDLPTPQNPSELTALSSALVDIGAAARAVGALRHDVLFLGPTSPVAAPDVAAAEQLALAVLDYAENGSAARGGPAAGRHGGRDSRRSRRRRRPPPSTRAPSPPCVSATPPATPRRPTTSRGAPGAQRRAADCRPARGARVADARPGLDGGSAVPGRAGRQPEPVRFGLAWFTPTEQLLQALPAPDRADVVVVLDAGRLGIDRALLAAAAPRVVAAVPPGGRAGSADAARPVEPGVRAGHPRSLERALGAGRAAHAGGADDARARGGRGAGRRLRARCAAVSARAGPTALRGRRWEFAQPEHSTRTRRGSDHPAMSHTSRRAAILSYRLGMADGVSVTAAHWATALRRLGADVTTVAGEGRADLVIPGLAIDAPHPPSPASSRARSTPWTSWWSTTSARCR